FRERERTDMSRKNREVIKAANMLLKANGDGKSERIGSLSDPVCSEEASEIALTEMLIEDNRAMREAGCELAEAAIRVVQEYDGCHRLMMAVSKWATAIANEGGRKKLYS